MQSIQLCGPVLPPPKLRLSTERSTPLPTEARRAALRAAETLRRVDETLAANAPCHYCESSLYEEIPDDGCPACAGRYRQYAKDLRSGMRPDIAEAMVRYRHDRRRSTPADHPSRLLVPVEHHPPTPIISIR